MQAPVPESAPFSPEQRTWLNGFLTGLLSLETGVNPLSPAESAAFIPAVGAPPQRDAGPDQPQILGVVVGGIKELLGWL